MRNVLPDWSVRLVVLCLLLPALVAALDAFFRARRHRLHAGAWVGWVFAAGRRCRRCGRGCAYSGSRAPSRRRGPVLPSNLALTSDRRQRSRPPRWRSSPA